MNLFNLICKIFLDNEDFVKKLDESKKSMESTKQSTSSFSSKASAAFKSIAKTVTAFAATVTTAATAVVAFSKKMIDSAGEIDDNAQQLGMSTEQYQAWAFAMEKAGTDASTLQTVMREMSTFTQELAEGNGDALLTLEKLGIGYDEFMQMDNAGQLETLVTALQGVEDSTDKAALAQELFGNRAYQKLMPLLNEEQGSFEQLNEELKENGLIVSDDLIQAGALLGDKIQFLTGTVKAWAMSMAADLFPQLSAFIDALQAMINGSDDAADLISDSFHDLLTSVTDMLLGVANKFVDALPDIISILRDLLNQVLQALPQLLESILAALPDLLIAVVELADEIIKILPDITKKLFNAVGSLLHTLLFDIDWGQLIGDLLTAFSEVLCVQLPSFLMDIIDEVVALFTTGEGWTKILKMFSSISLGIFNAFISLAEGIINTLLRLLLTPVNFIIRILKKAGLDIQEQDWSVDFSSIKVDISDFSSKFDSAFGNTDETATEASASSTEKSTSNGGSASGGGKYFAITKAFADGGMLNDVTRGTMFALAGEDGAEIVTQGRYGTGVANVEQIAEAVEIGQAPTVQAIQQAAVAVVNGLLSGLRLGANNTQTGAITLKIGDKAFKAYVVDTTNEVLQQQGRQSLKKITAY